MGLEFIDLFDDWASSYDHTVMGGDPEYEDVFKNYDDILKNVAEKACGNVLEFGVGTGNLTEYLLRRVLNVWGIEPSKAMRRIAKEKFPNLPLFEGDFLRFPLIHESIDTIVSTYAFHHLTDEEKDQALAIYSQKLKKDGKIIFADTMFNNIESKKIILEETERKGFNHLLYDLNTEYYPYKETLESLFKKNGFEAVFTPLNRFVWLMEAKKR